MSENKSKLPSKSNLHPKSKHREAYDFQALTKIHPQLKDFVKVNEFGNESIDFFNPEAVKALNYSLLKYFYKIENWQIPANYLCPPIPGRADYIHHLAALIEPRKTKIKCLDIGVGANCIYPIIGVAEYGWDFVGSDIDPISIKNAQEIIDSNSILKGRIELRLQTNEQSIFEGIIQANEQFTATICNPPFHASAEKASKGSKRKLSNLKKEKTNTVSLNFGGQSNELWCEGGELQFVKQLISESRKFSKNCIWFSSLISKKDHLFSLYKHLKKQNVEEIKTIQMGQGNKTSHLLAWTYYSVEERKQG
ncbi:MAG: 23S rRNA (adenine(1618)-N(6))-methyltransferase RlmF [Flavobacteriales bacterium]|nr:23S rRNA (adenine(1618)-N(6))-methyltransferase RlmF [Flavobacteriales bacterium]